MRPPADLPREIVLLSEAFGRRLGMTADEFWAVVYRKAPKPPGWDEAWRDAFYPLPSSRENDTLDTMDATQIAPARRGRPLARRKHPFVAMLLKRRLTIAEVAAEIGRPRSSVKSWYKASSDEGARPIPRAVAEKLRELYGVPLSAWARIAD